MSGSHAYGLELPESDLDFRGVFAEPKEKFLGIGHIRDTVELKTPDVVHHELKKFANLALKGNPTVLEMLWTDIGWCDERWWKISAIKRAFLHKGSLTQYVGYAKAQLYRLDHNHRPATGTRGADPKYSCHLMRIMLAGIHLAETGNVLLRMDEHPFVMRIRLGEFDLGDVKRFAEDCMKELEYHVEHSVLPELPNWELIDQTVRQIREMD